LAATIADLPTLWAAPSTSDKDRKRLLRTLLGDVTITPDTGDPTRLDVGLRWKSGATQQLQVTRHRNATQLHNTHPAAIALARRIGADLDNAGLAAALNAAGHTTGTAASFTATAAGNLRHYQHIPYPGLLHDDERTPRQIAEHIGVSTGTIHQWITTGLLPARRGPANRWCVPFPPDVEQACRDRAANSSHQHTDIDHRPRQPDEYSIAEIANRLGVKHDVIYNWTQHHHLSSRRGPGGRLWIRLTPEVETDCLQRIVNSYKLPVDIKAQAQQRMEGIAI
jgi:transposase-like protein